MATIHVSPNGNQGDGENPNGGMSSINAACAVAGPGDTILIHGGVYREWVDPPRGGRSASAPLRIQAAAGESVVISGAEVLDQWQELGAGLWTREVPDAWFSGTNTLRAEIGGDWFVDKGLPRTKANCLSTVVNVSLGQRQPGVSLGRQPGTYKFLERKPRTQTPVLQMGRPYTKQIPPI